MKWFSIKKFSPPTGQYVFIRAVAWVKFSEENQMNYDYYSCAKAECLNKMEDILNWEFTYIDSELHDLLSEYKVTHFAMIDPIEIEE